MENLEERKYAWDYLRPLALVRDIWGHRNLVVQFTRREIVGRYKGSHLGLVWSLITPLFMLFVYTFAFGVVLKVRWPESQTDSIAEFAVALFCGLIIYNFFSECIGGAPSLILSVPNYVKKVVFPLEVLPVVKLGTGFFHFLMSLIILVAANFVLRGQVHFTLLLLPVLMLPFVFLTLGLNWFLASMGVFFRDLQPLVSIALMALFFLTPIFYSLSAIPQPYRTVISYSPLSFVVENSRQLVLWGGMFGWKTYGLHTLISFTFMLFGYAFFMRTKRAFADVM